MTRITLDESHVQYAVYGGAVLGGGGGGSIEEGLQSGRLAIEVGQPELITLDEMNDEDLLVTVALVGAPAAKEQFLKPIHYYRALELLKQQYSQPIKGIITNENGAGTTVNGWFQAALSGLPIIDCPCNGRAHPTGVMGALNLSEVQGYKSYQAIAGGKDSKYIEMVISGSLEHAATMVRRASVEAGGLVAVARNPISVSYLRQNGAPGAVTQAIEIGKALLDNKGEDAIDAVTKKLGGKVITAGTVTDFTLETAGGFDVGKVQIDNTYELTFWNEYMTLEIKGERLATFPDLIMTMDTKTAKPIASADIYKGQRLTVITAPKENLILSTTMHNKRLLKTVEDIINKSIINF